MCTLACDQALKMLFDYFIIKFSGRCEFIPKIKGQEIRLIKQPGTKIDAIIAKSVSNSEITQYWIKKDLVIQLTQSIRVIIVGGIDGFCTNLFDQ